MEVPPNSISSTGRPPDTQVCSTCGTSLYIKTNTRLQRDQFEFMYFIGGTQKNGIAFYKGPLFLR